MVTSRVACERRLARHENFIPLAEISSIRTFGNSSIFFLFFRTLFALILDETLVRVYIYVKYVQLR